MKYDIIVVGGGAAGFFSAINIAEKNPGKRICILEKSSKVLAKVKISGGGRCNFTHACYDPKELTKYYPRGNKELLGPFHRFASGDILEWFESRDVKFYVTDDGSIFPESDDSQTIIDLFIKEAKKYKIDVFTNQNIVAFDKKDMFEVKSEKKSYSCEKLVITTGSNKEIWSLLEGIGHNIVKPVPSLFTFKIKDKRIDELMGLVVENTTVSMLESKIPEQSGPLLITHWGMSGPSILKLSSFGARAMFEKSYQFKIKVNWLFSHDYDSVWEELQNLRDSNPKKKVINSNSFDIPNRLWKNLVSASDISEQKNWADLSKKQINNLASELTQGEFLVNGRFKFKEEFVTAGGVNLKEINFKRFESKVHKDLYMAGEVLDIDAVTGGFNFQNAWTGAWIISEAITE
ncbi:MAG: NAD(P)/FAD-dependent oxidoreductase [Bacteroidota bacterium]